MIKKAYSVYDKKALMFTAPFYMVTEAQAVRAFSNMVNSSGNDIHSNPEDFTLMHVGDFDDTTGQFETDLTHPNQVSVGIELVKREELNK